MQFRLNRRSQIGLALLATITLVALIGVSRVYLGVHWPSDVLGGFLGGVAPLAVSVHFLHRGIT